MKSPTRNVHCRTLGRGFEQLEHRMLMAGDFVEFEQIDGLTSIPTDGHEIRVLTHNVYGKAVRNWGVGGDVTHCDRRAQKLGEYIANQTPRYDIVAVAGDDTRPCRVFHRSAGPASSRLWMRLEPFFGQKLGHIIQVGAG